MARAQRILLVEDEENVRRHVLETIAEIDRHFLIEEAEDGVEALETIEAASEPFDLIVTDISMPRLDGEALLWELERRECPSTAIVLTAFGQDDHVIQCLRAGACDYLVKPVDIDELSAAILNALTHKPKKKRSVTVDYDPDGWFEISGCSDYTVLFRYRRFLSLLDRYRQVEGVAEDIRLALEELGRNAIEWGNRSDPDKKVRFACRILPNKIIIQIADEGSGFVLDEVPDPSEDPLEHIEYRQQQGKRLGGYGIHLVRNLMDKLVYNTRGNVVVAIKYLNNAAPSSSARHHQATGER